eukprot:TCONS_00021155-protein
MTTNIEKSLSLFRESADNHGFLVYSRGGSIPYLTSDNFETIFKDEHTLWHIPVSTIYEQPGESVIKKYGKSFMEFANLANCTLMLNVNDSAQPKEDLYKYNEEKAVSVWAPSGRQRISPDEYMNLLKSFGIGICLPPSDQIPGGAAKKRCQKSCDRSVRFLDRCLEIRKEQNLDIPVFGVLEGGDSIGYREKCIKEVIKRDIDGYVFSGFDVIGPDWKDVMKATLEFITDKKLKIMFGLFTPLEVIEAVEFGVDLFDSVICCHVAESGCALNFKFRIQYEAAEQVVSIPSKRSKQDKNSNKKDLSLYEMDLHDDIYTEDMTPLVEGCTCYCCTRYTRAYLHHLLVTKEMLSEVLLMIHNLHHWKNFFKELLVHKRNNSLEQLKKIFE